MPIRPENRARYPKDWKLRSYFVRVVRAKNRCEWCGAENGQPHPQTGSIVVLTTAHVHDDRPEACSLLNLAALCQKCHNGHDAFARRARWRERHGRPDPALPHKQQLSLRWAPHVRRAKRMFGIRLSPKERREQALTRAGGRPATPSWTSPNPAVEAPPCVERLMGIEGWGNSKP